MMGKFLMSLHTIRLFFCNQFIKLVHSLAQLLDALPSCFYVHRHIFKLLSKIRDFGMQLFIFLTDEETGESHVDCSIEEVLQL